MATIEIFCKHCNSYNVKFVGYNYSISGLKKQRCECKSCGKKFQLDYAYASYRSGVKEQIVSMSQNGSGIRDTARVLKVSRRTVHQELLKKKTKSNT